MSRGHERPQSQCESFSLTAPPALNLHTHALFLDLDGTIAPIVDRPDMVQLSADLREVLSRLSAKMQGAIALVTGRTIADADHILGGVIANIAGVHGYELRLEGDISHSVIEHQRIDAALRDAATMLRQRAPGVSIENKTASLALHYRQAPSAEPAVRRIAEELAAKHSLRTLPGKMVIELVAGAHSKADALDAYMSAPPFAGRTPIAVGDDVTDEAAFAAANVRGGLSVLVGEPRESSAHYRLSDPAAVAAWLGAALERAP